ncbi:MAG: TetR/AcrR family transcriptional regulator [Spirochaetes bacterium]|nr:TetR/AcrR family transcriptional regulator [Spirochaetota bacterium]
MARRKDEDKRQTILSEAKKRFAHAGYESTSMTELARLAGIPVGSLYTYFDSKEGILTTIVEEGWAEFRDGLLEGLAFAKALIPAEAAASADPAQGELVKLSYLVKVALPGLFRDLDLIAILLVRAGKDSGLEEKLDFLADLVVQIIERYSAFKGGAETFDRAYFRTGLAVFLLGSLEVMRLIFHSGITISRENLIAFLTSTVEGALGCSLPDLGALPAAEDSWPGAKVG